ncbi:DNA-binding protein [Pullulanibacillus camelliae]|uniref:DNA-binding protein n=1 Tax=Pullulanibacillus camelliae TaxID=1707096 RepID=A0A8J2YKA5_9BACL|nr:carboxymuconolactone decarboxylase family protein [Pullulanibacillus camelliae]GGE48431.1 DNA-binding protein [Pullulanibacillus camelliae]
MTEKSDEPISLSEAILYDYKEGIEDMNKKMPVLGDAYQAFQAACFEEGQLSKKVKQLIALGISIGSQDEYAMVYHTKGCMDQGCTAEEIFETIGVAAAFGGGGAMSQGVTIVQQAMEEMGSINH